MALVEYISVAVLFLIGSITVIAFLILNRLLAPKRQDLLGPDGQPLGTFIAYECGEIPIGEAHQRFSFQYYVFALVFVLFDVITAFLLTWSVSARTLKLSGVITASTFLAIIFVGFGYWWKKRALRWM